MISKEEHWDTIFSKTEDNKLGWYEKDFSETMKMLDFVPALEDATVFIAGAGTSTLPDILYDRCSLLVLNDISRIALEKTKSRMQDRIKKTDWLCQSISKPISRYTGKIDVWIDRAVLHFLTEENDIEKYFDNVMSLVKKGGYVMFAEFSKDGATKCAGLHVRRYSADELAAYLKNSFTLVASESYEYKNPSGETRPYIYTLFRRVN